MKQTILILAAIAALALNIDAAIRKEWSVDLGIKIEPGRGYFRPVVKWSQSGSVLLFFDGECHWVSRSGDLIHTIAHLSDSNMSLLRLSDRELVYAKRDHFFDPVTEKNRSRLMVTTLRKTEESVSIDVDFIDGSEPVIDAAMPPPRDGVLFVFGEDGIFSKYVLEPDAVLGADVGDESVTIQVERSTDLKRWEVVVPKSGPAEFFRAKVAN